jgi:hypothetical protein
MRGGLLGFMFPMAFTSKRRKNSYAVSPVQAPASVALSRKPTDPLVSRIVSQVSVKQGGPVVQKANTLFNTIKKARDAVINLKKSRKTFQNPIIYKTKLSELQTEKRSLRQQYPVQYKQVKKIKTH